MLNKKTGVSLIELIMSIVLMSLVVLGFFSIELFSRQHVIGAEERSKVQNEISYAIEYMSKYVQQASGDINNPPITRYPASGTQSGFRARVDLNSPKTPNNLTDDTWANFYLSGNTIISNVSGVSTTLTSRVVTGFSAATMPASPTSGFYVNITDNGAAVDIGLVGRHNPAVAVSADNPQVAMKTRLANSSTSLN